MEEPLKCLYCGNELDEDEQGDPYRDKDGDVLCRECYHEHCEFTCHWCENYADNDQECAIGSFFAVFEPVPARGYWFEPENTCPEWFDAEEHQMLPGLYRITKHPMYGDAILDSWLEARSFEWVAELTDDMKKHGGYADYPCGPLCLECQKKFGPKEDQ